jgi:rhombotail lipoprotein
MHEALQVTLFCLLALLSLGGCASMFGNHTGTRQAGSIVDYLYPDAKEPPKLEPTVTRLRLPVRVGIAFVPGGGPRRRSAGGRAGAAARTGQGVLLAIRLHRQHRRDSRRLPAKC